MKIYIDPQTPRDISSFTDEELLECGVYNRDVYKPIAIENIRIGKNKEGFVCISFDTKNHKYLDLNYSMWSSARVDEDGSNLGSKCLELLTQEQIPFKDDDGKKIFETAYSSLRIWLEPDTAEEADLLSGVMSYLPTKWSYEIAIMPYRVFGIDEKSESLFNVLEDDMVYDFDL